MLCHAERILGLSQVKVWDTRQPNPVANVVLSDRVYCMDVRQQAVVSDFTGNLTVGFPY